MAQEVDLITQLLPSIQIIGGVLIGGLITFLTTSYQQRKQNERLEYQLEKQYEKEIFAQGVRAGIEDFKSNLEAVKILDENKTMPSVNSYIMKQVKIMRLFENGTPTIEAINKIIDECNELI